MGYIASNNIRIFPSSERTGDKAGTNWLTEYNLSSIVNKLLGTKGFVITPDDDSPISEGKAIVEFNIGGYYVSTTLEDIKTAIDSTNDNYEGGCGIVKFTKSGKSVTATILLDKEGSDESYWSLSGSDKAAQTEGDAIDLIILETADNGTSYTVPITSRINLNNLLLDRANIGPTGTVNVAKGGTINNGGTIANSGSFDNTGTITSDGTINIGPTGTVNVGGRLTPTGSSGSIIATALQAVGGGTTVKASNTSKGDDNNLALLFEIDDGEIT